MTDVTVSDDLAERIENRVRHTDFESVDEYVEFVVSEVLTRVERDAERSESSTAPREAVQNRLQSLGYLEE